MDQAATDNADQFKQSFREEAREILVDLESALLELNENRADLELVGRVFRALHTIKGSGSMFGFEELAAFTHNLETAFDQVRNGRLQIDSELIDLTLAALDQIRAMLEEAIRRRAPGPRRPAPRPVPRFWPRCGNLPGSRRARPPDQSQLPQQTARGRSRTGQMREWRFRFAPGPDFMLNGANPFLLLRELRQLGGLSVRASMAAVPPFGEMDPERCYVTWEMVLATAAGRDAIRDVFIFVEDSCELTIEPDSRRTRSRTQAPRKAFRKRRPDARQTSLPGLLKSSAPVREAAEPTTRPTTPPACACPPPSWTSLSIWWASW